MNVALWAATGLLAAVYLVAGLGKIFRSYDDLTQDPRMGWTNDYSAQTVKLVGAMELLGVVGLILPPLLGVAEDLVPLAATGLALIAIGAIVTHARRNEFPLVITNALFALLAGFVALGRFWIEPF